MYTNDLFATFSKVYEMRRDAEMSLSEFLEGCRDDPMRYANAAERILAAIGDPEVIDTAKNSRLGRHAAGPRRSRRANHRSGNRSFDGRIFEPEHAHVSTSLFCHGEGWPVF